MSDADDLGVYLWPAKGDDPFKLNSDTRRLLAGLNFRPGEPWYQYAEGFKRLGDIGVRNLEETGRGQDSLVFPIVFNYRHFIELSLKQIIRVARDLLDEPGDVPRTTHDLETLWSIALPLLEEVSNDVETCANVGACLARFNALDPNSEAFRYPVSTSGNPSLPGVGNIDLGQVRDVVGRLAMFFECVDQVLDDHLDAKHEVPQ